MLLMAEKMKEAKIDEELIKAIRIFDRTNNVYFTYEKMKKTMINQREKLTAEKFKLSI